MFIRSTLFFVFLTIAALTPVSASVISVTGQALVVPPPASVTGSSGSNTLVFTEQTNLILAGPITADISTPGTYNTDVLSPGIIPAGTIINSTYAHSGFSGTVSSPTLFDGSITFSSNILGVVALDGNLLATNSSLAFPGTVYPNSLVNQGFEFGVQRDTVIISADRRTLTFSNETVGGTDDLRIITVGSASPVPEPATWSLMLVAAFTATVLGRWIRRPRQA